MSSIETEQTNNLFRVHNIDGKTWQTKRSSSETKNGRTESITGQNEWERTETSSFQDPKHQMEHLYSKNTCIWSKSSSFQDHSPWRQEQKWQKRVISRPLIQSILKQVQELNPKYYLPTNKQTQIISEPARALSDWPQEESIEAPLQVLRFNPIYMESGSIWINSTRDLQTLYPNSFDQIGDMSGEYNIKTDPCVLPVQHRRHKVPIEHKAEIKKRAKWDGLPRYHSKTNGTNTMGKLPDIPKKTNGKLRICLNLKDLNKAIIWEHHKAPTLKEIAHILTRATKFSKEDGNKAFLECTWPSKCHYWQHLTHTSVGTSFSESHLDSKCFRTFFKCGWMTLSHNVQAF